MDATLAKELRSASFFLGGLRYDEDQVADLYARLTMIMEDSTTYQGFSAKGGRRAASKRFGNCC